MSKFKSIYHNGNLYELSREELYALKNKNLSIPIIEQRLRDGWSYEQATTLNASYVMKNGIICFMKALPDVTLYIPLNVMQEHSIQYYRIEKHYKDGYFLDEIIGDDFEYFVEYNSRTKYDLANEDVKRKKRAERLKREKEMKKRPWLYDGTPQPPYARDKYTQYLMQTSIYPKAVR